MALDKKGKRKSTEDSSKKLLDNMLSSDFHEKDDSLDIFSEEAKKKKKKKVILFSSIGAITAAVIVGIIFLNPFGGNQNFGDSPQEEVSSDGTSNSSASTPFYQTEGNVYPIQYDDWELSQWGGNDDTANLAVQKYALDDFIYSGRVLPSESSGFTSDLTQKTDDQGRLNPKFSFWTQERYNKEVSVMIESLLNPSFGGWGIYQYPYSDKSSSDNLAQLSYFFTESWLKDKSPKDAYPIYADWNSDNYGNQTTLLDDGTRWIGSIESGTSDFSYNQDTQQYTVNLVLNVKYSAWQKDQGHLEKNGKITLELVANPDVTDNSAKRVLINNAKLEVE